MDTSGKSIPGEGTERAKALSGMCGRPSAGGG